jgi:hypothetical protein
VRITGQKIAFRRITRFPHRLMLVFHVNKSTRPAKYAMPKSVSLASFATRRTRSHRASFTRWPDEIGKRIEPDAFDNNIGARRTHSWYRFADLRHADVTERHSGRVYYQNVPFLPPSAHPPASACPPQAGAVSLLVSHAD